MLTFPAPALLSVRTSAALTALLLLAVACGDDAPSNPPGPAHDAGTDSGSGDTAVDDDTASPPPPFDPALRACLDALASPEGVRVRPAGEPHVQPSLAVDETGFLQLAWSGPSGVDANLSPWVGRVTCFEGTPVEAVPGRVNTAFASNEGQPRVAVLGDHLLAVWQRADGESNRVLLRRHVASGEFVDDGPRELTSLVDGRPVEGRAWQPDVAAFPDGSGYVVVATWAAPDATSFRTFLQRVNADGTLRGPGVPIDDGGEGGHESPAVIALPDGSVRVAWDERTETKDDIRVASVTFDGDDARVVYGGAILPAERNAVNGPALTWIDHAGDARAWLTFGVFADAPAWTLDVTQVDNLPAPVPLSGDERAFRTRLTQTGPETALAVWQSRETATSVRGTMRAQWLRVTPTGLAPDGDPIEFDHGDERTHLVYPLALAPWRDGAVVAWTASGTTGGWGVRLRHLLR